MLRQGFRNWAHVPQGVYLPISRCALKVSNRKEKICLYITNFEIFIHISVNFILKNHCKFIGKYIFSSAFLS